MRVYSARGIVALDLTPGPSPFVELHSTGEGEMK